MGDGATVRRKWQGMGLGGDIGMGGGKGKGEGILQIVGGQGSVFKAGGFGAGNTHRRIGDVFRPALAATRGEQIGGAVLGGSVGVGIGGHIGQRRRKRATLKRSGVV